MSAPNYTCKIADSDGEIRGLALHLLFEDFDNQLEIKLDEEFNGKNEIAMNEVRLYNAHTRELDLATWLVYCQPNAKIC